MMKKITTCTGLGLIWLGVSMAFQFDINAMAIAGGCVIIVLGLCVLDLDCDTVVEAALPERKDTN